jgi:CRISPR/Cas system-associated exonuclease Cas4 (RecB family)
MKYSPYSYSKISSFYSCPFKFKLSYVDGIWLKSENKALEKGVRVHEIIEHWTPKMKNLPSFNYVLLDSKESQKEVEGIALNFCNSDLGQRYLMNPGVIGHEIHMGLDKRLNPCNYHLNSSMLRGKIDFLIKDKNKLIVVDWKTGKVPNQMYMSNDQVMLYAIWGFNMFSDVDTIVADYVYVEHNDTYSFTFTRDNYKNYTKNYANKLKGIETEEIFPKKTGPLCNYCDYKKNNYCEGI